MADCSLSGLMQAAMQDQEAAVAEARRAALEEAAMLAARYTLRSTLHPRNVGWNEACDEIATAIRALKEPTT